MNGRVLVMCAARGRQQILRTMVDSVYKTSSKADIAVYLDDDDREDYGWTKGIAITGPRLGQCKSLNELAARHPGYEAYGAATDDCTFITDGWDRWVLGRAAAFKGGIGAICPFTLGSLVGRMDFPWLTGRWVEVWGRFVPYETEHFYWDVALQWVGESTQMAAATREEFCIEHTGIMPVPEEPGPGLVTDWGRRIYNAYNDARVACAWMANERPAMVAKLIAAIKEAS